MPEFSETPQISNLVIEQRGEKMSRVLLINFGFEDRSGDIGLSPDDRNKAPYLDTLPDGSLNEFHYNLYIRIEKKVEGKWEMVQNPFNNSPLADFPYPIATQSIESSQGGPVNGKISYHLEIPDVNNGPLPKESEVKVVLFVYDRALNKSNTIESGAIVLE